MYIVQAFVALLALGSGKMIRQRDNSDTHRGVVCYFVTLCMAQRMPTSNNYMQKITRKYQLFLQTVFLKNVHGRKNDKLSGKDTEQRC